MAERDVDRQLVTRAQRGDKRAFELLVEKYQRKLARLLSRFIRDPAEVEDVTQEAFIKAYRALPAFRGDSAFYTWLYRIGINTAKNYLMAMGRRAPTPTQGEAEGARGVGGDGGNELGGHGARDGVSDRHGPVEDLQGARGDRGAFEAVARYGQGQEVVGA